MTTSMFKLNSTSGLILYPDADYAWRHVAAMHLEYAQTGNSSGCQLLGVSGLGKSTLLKNYAGSHPVRSDATGVVKPVIYFAMPSAPTPKTIMGSIVKAFGGADVGTAGALMDRAVHYLNHFRTEVLLADEAHHLIDRGRMRTHAHLGDCLKEFNDRVSCCFVLAGAPRLTQLFETNNQLRNRAGENLVLRPFTYEAFEVPLSQFILCFIKGGPLEEHGGLLTSSDVLMRVQFATDGVHAHIVLFLQNLSRAVGDAKGIDLTCMDKSWRFLGSAGLPPNRRPFHRNFNFERLSSLGEPFFPSTFDGDNHAPYF